MNQESFTHTFESTNGVELHVTKDRSEDDPVILFLHGFPEFWFGWRHQIPYFAKRGYEVWAPDLRGYNRSEKPESIADYNMEVLADDVTGLLEKINDRPTYLVGHDWGGAVAWWVSATRPDLFEKLVIINVPHPIVLLQHLHWDLYQNMRSWYMYCFQIPKLPEFMSSLGNWWMLERELRRTSLPGTFTKSEFDRYREAWSRPGAFTAMLNWYRALFRCPPDQEKINQQVDVPTLILWGENDTAMVDGVQTESLELCKNGRLVEYSDATHWVHHERPGRVNDSIRSFLRSRD